MPLDIIEGRTVKENDTPCINKDNDTPCIKEIKNFL